MKDVRDAWWNQIEFNYPEHTELYRKIGSCLGSVSQLINFRSVTAGQKPFPGGKWCVNAILCKVLLGSGANTAVKRLAE